MIESEHHFREDLGQPVLLKRLGNTVEANLTRARLESAGIPSFLGQRDVFSGSFHPAGRQAGVDVFVPASLLHEALDLLEAPPVEEPEPFVFEPLYENPARRISYRALVSSIIGWLLIVLHPIGVFLAFALFIYVLYLSYLALAQTFERDARLRARVVVAVLISLTGIGASMFFIKGLLERY